MFIENATVQNNLPGKSHADNECKNFTHTLSSDHRLWSCVTCPGYEICTIQNKTHIWSGCEKQQEVCHSENKQLLALHITNWHVWEKSTCMTSVHDLLCPSQTEVLPLKTGGFTTQNLLHCLCLYSSLLGTTNSVKQMITNITMCSSFRCYAASLAVSLLGIPAKKTNFPVLWRWCDTWYRISATTR